MIGRARNTEVLGKTVRLASPEASIIYKILAQRRRDLDEVESIFATHGMRQASRSTGSSSSDRARVSMAERLDSYRARYG